LFATHEYYGGLSSNLVVYKKWIFHFCMFQGKFEYSHKTRNITAATKLARLYSLAFLLNVGSLNGLLPECELIAIKITVLNNICK
jgi:hypothetical protein